MRRVPDRCVNSGPAATRRNLEEDVMQRYQFNIISGEIKRITAETVAVLHGLGVSSAVLADPTLQEQITQVIAAMATTQRSPLCLSVTRTGGAQ